GRGARHNCYYVNYKVLVDVVKYKLEQMRRRIEADERDSATRSSFKCPSCSSTYTDLEVNQLFDALTGTFRCTYCSTEVEEDASALPRRDARTLLARFNEQLEPLFLLLRETEGLVLPHEVLEPQPTEIPHLSDSVEHEACSGVLEGSGRPEKWASSSSSLGSMDTQSLVIDVQHSEPKKRSRERVAKEQPVWMSQSTVEAATAATASAAAPFSEEPPERATERGTDSEIIQTLLMHESKSRSGPQHGPLARSQPPPSGSDTSEAEEDAGHPGTGAARAAGSGLEREEEPETQEPLVMVAGQPCRYSEVSGNPELVSLMSGEEREAYVRVGQEMFRAAFE
ncbi:T2EA factor, partial [Eudromia elegans]|nr:T2EA factor [Eudromia elegans]